MKILILNMLAPIPPYDGGSIRSFEYAKALAEHHTVTFIATYRKDEQPPLIKEHLKKYNLSVRLVPPRIDKHQWNRIDRLQAFFSYPPSRIKKFIGREYIESVRDALKENYDVIISNTILSGQVFFKHNSQTPKILDVVDIFAQGSEREWRLEKRSFLLSLEKYADWHKTARYERQVWSRFNSFIAISDNDAIRVKQAFPTRPVVTIPNGIARPSTLYMQSFEKNFDLLFVGSLDYSPNIDALVYFDEEIMPLLLARYPKICVAIVGKQATEVVKGIANKQKQYHLFINVPDVTPYYAQAKVVILPVRLGSGIKTKFLEALAFGIPSVATPSASFGVPVKDSVHTMIASSPAEFAGKTISLLENPDFAQAIADEGKAFVTRLYDWDSLKKSYLEFVQDTGRQGINV